MYRKLVLFCLLGVFGGGFCRSVEGDVAGSEDSGRQKKLLFYDEDGSLVKTYANPLRNFYQSPIQPFVAYLRPSQVQPIENQPLPYMLQVPGLSQQAVTGPFQNRIYYIPTRDQPIEYDPLCSGKRAQIPSPRSCSNFLNCWDGWAYEQECPAGLMFSNLGYCDYPENVDCLDRKAVPNDEPKIPEPQCAKDFETFRNAARCSEFFVCVNKVPVRFQCPADLVFSMELGVCDYQSKVNCSASYEVPLVSPVAPITLAPPAAAVDTSVISPPSIAGTLGPIAAPSLAGSLGPIAVGSTPTASNPQNAEPQPPPNMKILMLGNTISSSHSWTSTRVAMGRQDAIRQLELTKLAKVKANY